jgi:group I intron endonuclease
MRGIYSITNTITGTVYYGQSVDIGERLIGHKSCLRGNYHRNDYLQRAWNKYGEIAFVFKSVEIVENIAIDLTSIEKKYFDSTDNKYNICDPEEAPSHSLETRKKIAEGLKGNKNKTGFKLSEETKKKISLNHNQSIEYKNKLSIANIGKVLSKETIKKISLAKIEWWKNKKAAKVLQCQ